MPSFVLLDQNTTHVTKRGILSHIADPDREVKAKVKN